MKIPSTMFPSSSSSPLYPPATGHIRVRGTYPRDRRDSHCIRYVFIVPVARLGNIDCLMTMTNRLVCMYSRHTVRLLLENTRGESYVRFSTALRAIGRSLIARASWTRGACTLWWTKGACCNPSVKIIFTAYSVIVSIEMPSKSRGLDNCLAITKGLHERSLNANVNWPSMIRVFFLSPNAFSVRRK